LDSFVRVAELRELPPGSSRAAQVGRYEVAIFNVSGELFALENCCPHQGGTIVDGSIEQCIIACPWHGWRFDLRTGNMILGEFAYIPRFAVKVEQGGIYVATEPIPHA
jgi:nitrite reductase (NADH) small subunit